MKTIEQKAQDFALGQVLSEWEDGLSYEDILAVLESDNPDENERDDGDGWRVIAWEPYENDEPWQIAQTIRDMVRDLVDTFREAA
jgi:DNA phosphorothioation-dependent restriction protein DptG